MEELSLMITALVGILTIAGIAFSVFWKVLMDVKKSAHARMDSIEERVNKKVDSLSIITLEKTLSSQHSQLSNRVGELSKEMHDGFMAVQSRVDNLIVAVKNGKK